MVKTGEKKEKKKQKIKREGRQGKGEIVETGEEDRKNENE